MHPKYWAICTNIIGTDIFKWILRQNIATVLVRIWLTTLYVKHSKNERKKAGQCKSLKQWFKCNCQVYTFFLCDLAIEYDSASILHKIRHFNVGWCLSCVLSSNYSISWTNKLWIQLHFHYCNHPSCSLLYNTAHFDLKINELVASDISTMSLFI